MMLLLERLAEERIREAQERGEFEGLPGAGAPLELDDDALVPEELRAAYRVLRNAGFVPPELEARREIAALERLLDATQDAIARAGLVARIDFLLGRTPLGRRGGSLRIEADYYEKIAARLAARRRQDGSRP